MANVARRSFLKLIGAAPIAGPVVAKEAAAKMGMGTLLGGAASLSGETMDAGYSISLDKETNMLGWCKAELRNVFSDKNVSAVRQSIIRNGDARILDSDLAAMRSASPAAAYQIQIDRCVARRLEDERLSWLERIASYTESKARVAR